MFRARHIVFQYCLRRGGSMACENTINNVEKLDNFTKTIVDYLMTESPNLWKLLYYTDRQPLIQPDLTLTQKANMICKDPNEDGATANKNILFQLDTEEGIEIGICQLRIKVGDIIWINPYQAWAEILFRIVVPNKLGLIVTNYSQVADRSLAILRELTKALRNNVVPNSTVNSPMFMNRSAPEGAGRKTGAFAEGQNTSYSGYLVSMAVLI